MTLQEQLNKAYELTASLESALRQARHDARDYEAKQLERAKQGLPIQPQPTELEIAILENRHTEAMQKAKLIQETIWQENYKQRQQAKAIIQSKITALLPAILSLCDEERALCAGHMEGPASFHLEQAIRRSKLYKP